MLSHTSFFLAMSFPIFTLLQAVMLKCTYIFKLYSLDFSCIMSGLILQLVIPRVQKAGFYFCRFSFKAYSVVVICGIPYTM